MEEEFEILPGLPPYGPPAIDCPRRARPRGLEGFVVAFSPKSTARWTGNFGRGLGSLDTVLPHPDGLRLIVIAGGAIYEVTPSQPGPVQRSDFCVTNCLPLPELGCYIFGRNHIELMRWGPEGKEWQTRRISWDGFTGLRRSEALILGEAWNAPSDEWCPFAVDIMTGEVTGGPPLLAD